MLPKARIFHSVPPALTPLVQSQSLICCVSRIGIAAVLFTGGCSARQTPEFSPLPRAQAIVQANDAAAPDSPFSTVSFQQDGTMDPTPTGDQGQADPAATPGREATDPPRPLVPSDTDSSRRGEPPGGSIEPLPAPMPEGVRQGMQVGVADVVASIHSTFPLLEAAIAQRDIAAGKQLSALGGFDTKLKAGTENGPLGFYETYRHSAGFKQPVYQGGEIFGGYRIGRGDFQPWYLERETNEGGEFKAGFIVPLLRDREIDARRAELWRADYERQRAEPEIRAQLILFVRDGSIAFWEWVAAGRKYEIGKRALDLAQQRNAQLKRQADEGQIDPPIYQDNLRAIANREAKVTDLQRKLQQTAFKLSLFLRTAEGVPLPPTPEQLGDFPEPEAVDASEVDSAVAMAFVERPEFAILGALWQQTQVDLQEAENNLLPAVNAQMFGSQDMGSPTSSKRDKSQFELEAGVFVDVPLQRRKALGKAQAAEAKLMQIDAKRRFTEDKIRAQIQAAYAALVAAFSRLQQARESNRLAEYMADVERRRFQLGEKDLLAVALRERIAIEAAESEVDALLEYFSAKAEYDAAVGRDWPEQP